MIALKPLIEKLRAHGLDADAILDCISSAAIDGRRSSAADRQARYRARKNGDERNVVTSRDVTRDADPSPPSSPSFSSPTPPPITTPPSTPSPSLEGRGRERNGTYLPADWQPRP